MSEQTVWVVSNINEEKLSPLLIDQVNNLSALPTDPPYAIILSKSEGQNWIDLLIDLRRKKEYRYTPVFYHGDVEDNLRHLFDGPADDSVMAKATLIYERINNFGSDIADTENKDLALLAYLYSRGEMSLKGYKGHSSPYIFEYPLLTILFSHEADFDGWRFLQDLVMRDLLVQDALIDEIQTCSSCEAGLLNLRSSCPNCHSIDIKPQKFVHCYSCGKIGPVPEFLREERLICSRCKTKLHELGVDYEKPKEDKLCNSCGHFFAESDVEMVCLVCQRVSSASNLSSRRLYDYVLTRRGEYLVRGIEKSIYHKFSHFFKVIDHNTFMLIANWQAKLAARYSTIYFSVMTLQITNANELIEEHGEVNSERLMGEFFTSLRQVFRESDLASRLEGTMYFLLPLANQDGCMIIVERIKQAVQILGEQSIGKGLSVGVSYLTSAEIIQGELQGDMVIAELHTRMLESNICFLSPKK